MLKANLVHPTSLRFNTDFQQRVADYVQQRRQEHRSEVENRMRDLFLQNPFQVRQDLDDFWEGLDAQVRD